MTLLKKYFFKCLHEWKCLKINETPRQPTFHFYLWRCQFVERIDFCILSSKYDGFSAFHGLSQSLLLHCCVGFLWNTTSNCLASGLLSKFMAYEYFVEVVTWLKIRRQLNIFVRNCSIRFLIKESTAFQNDNFQRSWKREAWPPIRTKVCHKVFNYKACFALCGNENEPSWLEKTEVLLITEVHTGEMISNEIESVSGKVQSIHPSNLFFSLQNTEFIILKFTSVLGIEQERLCNTSLVVIR